VNREEATAARRKQRIRKAGKQEKHAMALAVHEVVPELTFLDPDGGPVTLSSFRGRPLLLVFLRHVA
jgi:hypothetical protein